MLRFYEQQLGTNALNRLALDLDTSLDVLRDPDRWFSIACFRELYTAMARATGDQDIVYRAGRSVTRPGVMGAHRSVIRAFRSVRGVLGNWSGLDQRLRRDTDWRVIFRGRGHAVATFSLLENAEDDIELCKHRRGILESIPELFDLPPAEVLHPECIHRGDSHCRYQIRWMERPNILRIALLMTLLSSVGAIALDSQESPFSLLLLGSTFAMLFVSFIANLTGPRGSVGVPESLSKEHIEELSDLLDRNRRRVQELQAIAAVAEAARTSLDEKGLVASVLEALRIHLGYRRVMLLLVLPKRAVLSQVRARGFDEVEDAILNLEVPLLGLPNRPPRLFAQILHSGQPILIRNVEALGAAVEERDRELLTKLGSSAFVAAPVVGGNEPLALLFVDRSASGEEEDLTLRDAELLGSVASTLGAALSNSRLFNRVQEELLINRKFRQYLPPQVVDEVRMDPGSALQLGGRQMELAVMLIDIAAFTSTSAALSPGEVVAGLNTWFAITDRFISQCNGIVDKRMGDGVLVVFLPEKTEREGRHPVERAAAAAVGIKGALDASRDLIGEAAPGFADMQVRYAIHYGTVTIGNFGSDHRMEYTVIGDAVNTCARLEEITPAGMIWLTGDAVKAPQDQPLVGALFEQSVTLRGYTKPTEIWSIPSSSSASNTGTWTVDEPSSVSSRKIRSFADEIAPDDEDDEPSSS
jgi:class 3 adenylate cyclase